MSVHGSFASTPNDFPIPIAKFSLIKLSTAGPASAAHRTLASMLKHSMLLTYSQSILLLEGPIISIPACQTKLVRTLKAHTFLTLRLTFELEKVLNSAR